MSRSRNSPTGDGPEPAAQRALNRLIERHRAPGLQYLLVDADRVVHRFNGGYADLTRQAPVADSTTFNGYSITKTVTAAAVVKLALQGKIDLDGPIADYLDEFPYADSPTVRQTLQHTGGFPNPNPIAWIHLAEDHATFDESTFVRNVIREHPKLRFRPGDECMYSNLGYLLLGEVVRSASGMTYGCYVQKEIIDPLGLGGDQRIAFTIDQPERHARGYLRRWHWLNPALGLFIDRRRFLAGTANGWVEFRNILVNGEPYGGLIGNASGFARYLQAALGAETPFSREMLDLLWKGDPKPSGPPLPYGLGWFRGDMNGTRYVSHSGGGGGYYCEIRIYPDARLASVIMTNNTGISSQRLLDRVDRWLLSAR